MSAPDLFLIMLANLAWGFNFIAAKIGAEKFQPLFFISIRFCFLLLFMLPWLKPAPGYMKPILKVAFLMGVLHFGMILTGLHLGGNIASIAITSQLYVPFSAILATIFLKERITLLRLLAIAIALSGVMVIGFDPIVFDHLDAVLWVIGAAFAMAVATIIMRQCPNLGVFKLQGWTALVAMPSLLFLSFCFESNHVQIISRLQIQDFWTPLYSATGASVVGHGLLYYLLGRYPVSTVTPLLLLAPILASIFGIIFFDDIIGIKLIIGGAITLTGIAMVSIIPADEGKKVEKQNMMDS